MAVDTDGEEPDGKRRRRKAAQAERKRRYGYNRTDRGRRYSNRKYRYG